MRTFVKYDQQGRIVGTARVESLPEGLSQPFLVLRPGESVLEVAEADEAATPVATLQQAFRVDPASRSLLPADGPQEGGAVSADRARPRRAEGGSSPGRARPSASPARAAKRSTAKTATTKKSETKSTGKSRRGRASRTDR